MSRSIRKRVVVISAVVLVAVGLMSFRHQLADAFKTRLSDAELKALLSNPQQSQHSGTLQIRGKQILSFAKHVLTGSKLPISLPNEKDVSGLILEVDFDGQQFEGTAQLMADLRAQTTVRELEPLRSGAGFFFARWLTPRVRIATAQFKQNKLDGTARIWRPNSDGLTLWGQANFKANVLHGEMTIYHLDSGKPAKQRHFRNGMIDGESREFFSNGVLAAKETFVSGLRDGSSDEFFANGKPRRKLTYTHGTPTGEEKLWYPTGQIAAQITYDGGRVVSERRWYSNGKLSSVRSATESQKNAPHGSIITYHRDGRVYTKMAYENGKRQGPFERFYRDGRRWESGQYRNDKLDGQHRKWWKNGKVALEETWSDGQRVGRYQRWYFDGTPWEDCTYQAGKRHGAYRKWWKNRKLAHKYSYESGRIHGSYKTWYETGQRWSDGRYEHGRIVGTMRRWFRNGRLGYSQAYEAGKPHGPFKKWYPDGKPRLVATYLKGKLHGPYTNWLENGDIYRKATYKRGIATTAQP